MTQAPAPHRKRWGARAATARMAIIGPFRSAELAMA